MLQAVIFDYDGTMFPTMERQHKWFKHWWAHDLNKERVGGKKFPFPKLQAFMVMYNREISKPGEVQNVYDFLGLDCDMNDMNHHPVWPAYKAFSVENPSKLYPGMEDTIREIWELGHLGKNPDLNRRLRLGINTSNSWAIVYSDLRNSGVLECFDSFISREVLASYYGAGNADSIKKPSKISLALATGLLDSPGEYALHVGDTFNDLIASQKVIRLNPNNPETLITVGVTWGYETIGESSERARSTLEKGVEISGEGKVYFKHIIDRPSELVNIVRGYLN